MAKLEFDREITISSAGNRFAVIWTKQKIYWSELIEKLKTPVRSPETLEEYLKYPKSKQDNLKDVGGFVGGELIDNNRKKGASGRDIIALDLDNIEAGQTQEVLKKIGGLGCAYVVYSTRKHSDYKPRLRILIPGNRTLAPDEYEPAARKLASMIGIALCDPTTFQVTRLMYWPSCSSDSSYVYAYEDKAFLNVDGILGMYKDWQDVAEWPQVPGSEKTIASLRKKQENPLDKTGIIGAFCKSYTIIEAIEKFIPDAYEIHENSDRLTFTGGSTFGGAILYEDGLFLYSHHATDPASMKLCNAFDLVRLHKFKDLDDEAKEGTPTAKLPSFTAMNKLMLKDEKVIKILDKERSESVKNDFYDLDPEGEEIEWMKKLKRNENSGQIEKTRENISIILENDLQLKGKMVYDEFSNRGIVTGALPWNKTDEERLWKDVDDAELRTYLETVYRITGDKKIDDVLLAYCHKYKINKVKKYLEELKWDGVKRVDTLLHDYLGAENNVYTQEVMRKSMVAAVARAMGLYVKWDQMPILSGPQGIGKSTFLRMLGKNWFSDSLQTFEGKDASETIQGTWINEIGELASMNRSELNSVKLFLSKVEDIFREAYGRRTEKFPRRCIFFGTTNSSDFLRDSTGDRRFWPVDVGIVSPQKSVFKELGVEVDQLWAEAFCYWQLGEDLLLSVEAQKIAEEEQKAHKETNSLEGLIEVFLEKEIPENWNTLDINYRKAIMSGDFIQENAKTVKRTKICALEIWVECLKGDPKNIQRRNSMEINAIVAGLENWQRCKSFLRFGPYGTQRGFIRKV